MVLYTLELHKLFITNYHSDKHFCKLLRTILDCSYYGSSELPKMYNSDRILFKIDFLEPRENSP